MKFKSKKKIILGYDLETVGVPQIQKEMYSMGKVLNDKETKKPDIVVVDDKEYKTEDFHNDNGVIKVKSGSNLLEINTQTKEILKTVLPAITSYGFVKYEIKTPSIYIDTQTKKLQVKHNKEFKTLEYSEFHTEINPKTDESEIVSFSTNTNDLYVVKDGFVFQRLMKGGKTVDKPLWDYFKTFEKLDEGVEFFSVPDDAIQAPEAVALTRLFQLKNLKNHFTVKIMKDADGNDFESKKEIYDWMERFEKKIKQDEPDIVWDSIDLEQNTDRIWDQFSKQFIEKYDAKELSSYPLLDKENYKKLIDNFLESDVVFGHNIIGFDNPLVILDNPGLFKKIYDKQFIDTMLIPLKMGEVGRVDNLNKALNRLIKNSKLYTKEEKEDMAKLVEERKRLHDALLDITANFYVFAEQYQKIYTKPDTKKYTEIVHGNFIAIPDTQTTEDIDINTIIGLSTDSQGLTDIDTIKEIADENGYKNIAISNYILNDFPKVNEKLNTDGKSIISMKFKMDGKEIIAVLKNPIDQVALENMLTESRDMTLKSFIELLNTDKNTIEFLVTPDFEKEFNIVNKKIGIRIDPFIQFDYENTKFKNKRVLTLSPLTDKNDINRYIAANIYQTAKNNEIMTGQLDYLKLLSWNSKDFIFGIPKKEELLKIFPPEKYKDIYENANKIGKQSQTFDLYSTNKREEFPNLEKLFGFKVPKLNEVMLSETINYLNQIFKKDGIVFELDGMKYKVIQGDISQIKEKVEHEFKLLNEKAQWKYYVKSYSDDFLNSDMFKALICNYVLLDKENIKIADVIPDLNRMDQKTKVQAILDYVENNHSNPKFQKAFDTLKTIYEQRAEHEMRVFNEMKNGEEYNTELSTFYYKYLVENQKIQTNIYKDAGVVTGPGRGSSGGSFIAWAMDITKVDPVKYETIFERFTNEYKTSKPDIDTDHSNRTKAIESIEQFMIDNYEDIKERVELLGIADESSLPKQKYLKNILNIVYFSRKTLFKGLAKALRISPMNSRKLEINFNETMSLKENIDSIVDDSLKRYFDVVPPAIIDILDKAAEDKTLIRNLGKHASGNILSNKVWEVLYTDKGSVESYGEKGEMPEKLDILGLQTLEIMLQYKINATIVEVDQEFNLNLNKYQINDFIEAYQTNISFSQNLKEFSELNKINLENVNFENVEKIYNSFEPDYYFADYNDIRILKMMKMGLTGGIFQMDARTQRRLLDDILSILEVAEIEKLPSFKGVDVLRIMTIINAVNRPGPLMAGMGDEIIINLRNILLEDLNALGLLDKYSEHKKLKRHIKQFEKNDFIAIEYYNSKRFEEFWTTNIEEERRIVALGEDAGGLISRMIKDQKSNEEIIEVFQEFERKMKNIPAVQKTLDSSFGTILYQEQIMQLSQELGSLTDVEADGLRKAVSKSNRQKIMEYINLFISGSEQKNLIGPDEAEYLGIKFQGFGSYAFNKAHSQAYSLIGYQSAIQKITNPALFYAVNFNLSKMENVSNMVDEIEKTNSINLITGTINQAVTIFSVDGNDIIIPITSYKGVTDNAANKIIQELKTKGEFKSFYDLVYRTLPELDKGTFQVLVKSGMLNDFIRNDGLSVKVILENITEVFELIKSYHYERFPKFEDIQRFRDQKISIEAEIEELEFEKSNYSNPVEIQLQIDTLQDKLTGKTGLLEKIEKGIAKNEKLLNKFNKEMEGKSISDITTASLKEILNHELNKVELKVQKAIIGAKKKDLEEELDNLKIQTKTASLEEITNINPRIDELKKEIKELEVQRKAIIGVANPSSLEKFEDSKKLLNNLLSEKEDYKLNDFKIFRYELLKNYAVENIKIDFENLPKFTNTQKIEIIKYSGNQFNGEDFISMNEVLENKYGIELDNNLNKALWMGKDAKMIFFTDFIPGDEDYLIESFEFQGKTYEPVSTRNYKPVLKPGETPDKNHKFDNKQFIFNKESGELELHYKEFGKPMVASPNEYTIGKKSAKFLKYFHEVLTASGLSLKDIIVLPACPMTKVQFNKIEESGINITQNDSIFTSRYRNILEQNEIEFAVMANTMNNNTIKRWNLAGQETDISAGKTYVLKLGDVQTKCFQIPGVNQGLFNTKEVINSFSNLIEIEQEDLEQKKSIDNDNVIEAEIVNDKKVDGKIDINNNMNRR